MDRGIARAGVEQQRGLPAVVDAVEAGLDLGRDAAERRIGRDAVVGRLDDAADRLRAVAQRRGAAIDLDLADRQRIDRHRMVGAQGGDVAGAKPVLLNADAIVAQAAQDRPAGAGREGRRGGARLGEEHVAEVLRRQLLDLAAGDRAERRVGLARQTRRCRRRNRRCGGGRGATRGAAAAGRAGRGRRGGGGAVTVTVGTETLGCGVVSVRRRRRRLGGWRRRRRSLCRCGRRSWRGRGGGSAAVCERAALARQQAIASAELLKNIQRLLRIDMTIPQNSPDGAARPLPGPHGPFAA